MVVSIIRRSPPVVYGLNDARLSDEMIVPLKCWMGPWKELLARRKC
jgi:hypothetical protein